MSVYNSSNNTTTRYDSSGRTFASAGDAALRRLDLRDLQAPRWWRPVGSALIVHSLALGLILTVEVAEQRGLVLFGVWLAILASILLAFPYRGLENLVHGASHGDILSSAGRMLGCPRRDINDLVGNLIAAMPVGQDVGAFRRSHVRDHHASFRSGRDPCHMRMLRHPDTARGRLPTLSETFRQMPRETIAFYQTVRGSGWTAIRGLVWHAALMIIPSAAIFGLPLALTAWCLVFLPLFMFTLPTIRTLAEAGEHDYRQQSAGLSVLECSFANEGLGNRLIHMFGDSFHPEHHIWPQIPQYRLQEARRRAANFGFGYLLHRRKSVLGRVETVSSMPAFLRLPEEHHAV